VTTSERALAKPVQEGLQADDEAGQRHRQTRLCDRGTCRAEPATGAIPFENRNGSYSGKKYDIVFGPVANDVIYRTFIAYEDGILTKDETISRLKVKKLYNQMTFCTEAALSFLKCPATQ